MKISVIVPTYNRARLVAETVQSALQLNYPDLELIVVDDGSTDETEKVLSRITDPRFRYLKKENGERGAARNFGAAHASGVYVNFFDSDDRLLSNHLTEARRCAEALGNPEVFALGFKIEKEAGRQSRIINALPDPMNLELLKGNALGCNPVFIRRDVFNALQFKEDRALAGSEDILLWLQLAARYPFRFWPIVTSILLDHNLRSVYGYNESQLEARNDLLLRYLIEDPAFMEKYGEYLKQIRAQRHTYTAVHLAVAGYHFLPLKHLAMAARIKFSSIFCLGTAGTLKHVLLGFFQHYRSE